MVLILSPPLDRVNGGEYYGIMAGIPEMKELMCSPFKVVDPKGPYGRERQRVPALLIDGVLYILGRQDEVAVPDGPAAEDMIKQVKKQIEEMLAQGAMIVGA